MTAASEEVLPLFVYGTLCSGEEAEWILRDAQVRRIPGEAIGESVETGTPYPGVVFVPSGRPVAGEIVWLQPEAFTDTMRRLDEYEDVPDLYRRVRVVASTPDGDIEAYAYEWIAGIDAG